MREKRGCGGGSSAGKRALPVKEGKASKFFSLSIGDFKDFYFFLLFLRGVAGSQSNEYLQDAASRCG